MKTLLLVAAVALLPLSCVSGDRCDPGMRFERNTCVAVPPDAASAPRRDAAPAPRPDAAPAGDGGAAMCIMYESFGEPCTTAPECRCGLDYCDTYNNANRCTMTGCKADPAVCPPGWSCMDLSVYGPTLPSICVKP